MASILEAYIDEDVALLENYATSASSVLEHDIAPRNWDVGLAEDMVAYQQRLGSPKAVDSSAGVFITGQQPGIFMGPLYTIYKAITAIQLAGRANQETDDPFVPIYWVGGDDHDFDEIAQTHLLNKHHDALSMRLDSEEGQPAQSIFKLPTRPVLHELVDQAATEATGSEFTGEIRDFLHDSLDVSTNLSDWHARLMARLFRDTPLLIFTPELQAARIAAMPVFEHEINSPLASTSRLNAGGDRLKDAGFEAQVVKDVDSCNFFVEHRSRRCRVRFEEGEFFLPDTGDRFTAKAMQEWLQREPTAFTANVALRCVVQQQLFPVRAYVAGPGELAYWGQLKGVFEHFSTPMPVVYPRIRAVLTSLKTNKLLKKYGLSPDTLDAPIAELEELALRSGVQNPSLDLFEQRRNSLEEILAGIESDFASLGKNGKGASDLSIQFRSQVEKSMNHLERSLLRADGARNETVRKQIIRLTTELCPERKPQERYYNVFSWLFQYGWDLIPRLIGALDHQESRLQEVEL
jgi:bacillithiol synthase